jgi:O-antigen ligase
VWADALESFKSSPLFGIGSGEMDKDGGHVAHNSFLQAFVELGIPGGILFFGAFGFSLYRLVRLGTKRVIRDPVERRLLTYVTALLVAYMVGMMSLTLNYIVPTYTILGITTVYLGMTTSDPPLPEKRLDANWLVTWTMLALAFLLALSLFVKMFLAR